MARPAQQWPPQPRERAGKVRVWWNGRWHHLGRADEPEAWQKEHARLIARWAVDPTASAARPDDYLVSTLCREYLESAAAPTGGQQRGRVVAAVKLLLQLNPETAVVEFGPNDLRAWQTWLCQLRDGERERFSVTTVNDFVASIRRIWKWGVSTERVEEPRYRALCTVEKPKPGQARAPREVPPADPEHVRATLPHLRPPVRAMVALQWLTGARPEEVCGLTPGGIQRTGRVWIKGAGMHDLDALGVWMAVLEKHKLTWKGKPRWLTFGAEAQAVLAPFLDRAADAFCFDPREAIADLRAELKAERSARGGGSGGNRKRPRPGRSRVVGNRYTPRTYREAVQRACVKAGVPHWYPYQLRHLAAAEVKSLFGIDGVQALLGHHTRTMSEHYGGAAVRTAAEVARGRAAGK